MNEFKTVGIVGREVWNYISSSNGADLSESALNLCEQLKTKEKKLGERGK
jgi:hypothetical protein